MSERVSIGNRAFAGLQIILPHHALCGLMFRLTRSRLGPWKNLFIRVFIRLFRVNMDEAVHSDPGAYEHFNAFFTRSLKPDARTLPDAPDRIACPVDGTVSQAGRITKETLFQAKAHDYSLRALLAGSARLANTFRNGSFATLYLSPRDYHRVHMPVGGRLVEARYVPGRLFSVNAATARTVPGLFARNERVINLFDTPAGPVAVILVGALFVGSMETVWEGRITPPYRPWGRAWRYPADSGPALARGEEMGRFNMGSTVILLFANQAAEWGPGLQAGATIRMGQDIGLLRNYS